jgi:hypothetical protein
VLEKQLRDDWHARERAVPIQPIMTFAPEGLVLGAGTILIPSEGPRRLRSLQGRQAHILALLSAAYGRSIAPSVLGNIERAVKSWRDGDECLAYIHLAHSRLQVPSDVRTAAYRLFVAEHAMKAGVRTSAVFQALNIDRSYIDAVEKAYNPAAAPRPSRQRQDKRGMDRQRANERSSRCDRSRGERQGYRIVTRPCAAAGG